MLVRTRIRVLGYVAAIAGLALGISALIVDIRESEARTQVSHRCRLVLQAISNYSETHGALPPSVHYSAPSVAASSWRFQIAPFLVPMKVDVEFAEPWDSDVNRRLRYRPIPMLCAPASTDTVVYTIDGPGTAINHYTVVPFRSVPDDTIVIVEVSNSKTHWMAPGDIQLNSVGTKMDLKGATLGPNAGAPFHVGFFDGEVWLLRGDTPPASIAMLAAVARAANLTREEVLSKYVMVRYGDAVGKPGSSAEATRRDESKCAKREYEGRPQ